MRVVHSVQLDLPAAQVRSLARSTATLRHVAWPVMTFTPVDPATWPVEWVDGVQYLTRIRLLGFIPLGLQRIAVSFGAPESTLVYRDLGGGDLASDFDHQAHVTEASGGGCVYSDTIEVKAGLVTPFVGAFVWFYYWYRQRRWRALARRGAL